MEADGIPKGQAEESEALAASWPRSLIADGRATPLAVWWVQSRDRSEALGLPRMPRHALDPSVANGLFEARRSRRLERGLEGAETLLAAEGAGLAKVPQAQARPDQVRISRLLIVSGDGSVRFYREVEKLRLRFAKRLEVLLLDCDEDALGTAAFGAGRRSRALLIHHKDAVVRFLLSLEIG